MNENRDITSTRPVAIGLERRTMKYQLVLQFGAGSLDDFDRLVGLEDKLIEELGDVATVDGHDFGSGEFNIFVLTDDPVTAFDKAHRIVIDQRVPNVMRSAYRDMDGEDYVILWPSSLTEFSVS
jgi:hypothetical protein